MVHPDSYALLCRLRLAGWAGWILLGLLLALPSHARVIGLVLDDSGSMRPVFARAQFATQLLVSMLATTDRLYLVRLNGEDGQVRGPLDLGDRPALLAAIRDQWHALQNHPTPYVPLDAMLDTLVAATPPDEEARLLVISDGAFTEPPPIAAVQARAAALNAAFQGKNLAVHFVVLHHRDDQRTVIDQQGIRDALLTTFNGSPDNGRVDIDHAQNVFPELRQVLTALYGTDPAAHGAVVRLDGTQLILNPPFSLRGLVVAVADEHGQAPARFQAASFVLQPDPPLAFEPATATHRANVYHLQPTQPLLPGAAYRLTFDRPLPADTQVLFDSGLDLELHFFLHDQPVTPNAQGHLVIAQDTPLEVRATLLDPLNPATPEVRLRDLPQTPVFTLSTGARTQPMTLDRARNDAVATVRYPAPGTHTLTMQVRYPGFVIRRAQDVLIDVQAVHPVTLTVTGERRDGCTDCAADETRATYTRHADFQDLFAVTLQAQDAPATGTYRLELAEPLPTGVRLLLPDGQTLPDGATSVPVTLTPGQPVQARLQYQRAYRATAPYPLRLTLRAERADWPGQATLALRLHPHRLTPHWRAAGHTGPDPTQPFQVAVTDLGQQAGVFLVAEDFLDDLDPTHLTVHSPTLPVALRLEGPDRVRVMPQVAWGCDCLTPVGEHPFTLDGTDPLTGQTVSYTGALPVLDAPWFKKCGLEAFLLLATLLLLAKTVCLLRTERFPPRSRLVVMDLDRSGPLRRLRLHSRWTVWVSCRDERRSVEGLALRALPHGAALRLKRQTPPTLCFEETGEPLVDAQAGASARERTWPWGGVLRDAERGQRYVLVKDIRAFRSDDDER